MTVNTEKWKMFPILPVPQYGYRREFVPYWIVEAHEAQAMKNHGGQSVKRLAERGGLAWDELYMTISDLPLFSKERKEHPYDYFREKCKQIIAGAEAGAL